MTHSRQFRGVSWLSHASETGTRGTKVIMFDSGVPVAQLRGYDLHPARMRPVARTARPAKRVTRREAWQTATVSQLAASVDARYWIWNGCSTLARMLDLVILDELG